MQVKAKLVSIIVFVIVMAMFSFVALADPTGPEMSTGIGERAPTASGTQVQAQAGNVTALSINASRVTERWQGYFGNITGTITLDDAQANSMYEWDVANPEGEIYASNGTITDWSTVFCFNFSNLKDQDTNVIQRFNGTDVENALGMDENDYDGFDETFNETFTGSFNIGQSVTIDSSSGCSLVSLNVNDQVDNLKFNETVLTDNNSLIYTSILEQDETGFAGSQLDFQILVGENGDVSDTTTYYFYIELS